MKKVALFSPDAGGSVGHGFIYAHKLLQSLTKLHNVSLFTVNNPDVNNPFKETGAELQTSSSYPIGATNKKRFNKFGRFALIFYGFYRIKYNYDLLQQYFKMNKDKDIYHLLEFEYVATLLFFFLNPKLLKKTVLGFHSSDFEWIQGRAFSINGYKYMLHFFLKQLVQKAKYSSVHGEILKKELMRTLKISVKCEHKIVSIPYGLNKKNKFISKDEAISQLALEIDSKNKIGLFFGVLREDKGLIELLEVMKNINPEVILVIAGSEGDIKISRIIEKINEEGINHRVVHQIKYLSDYELELYYSACDFVFVPHKKYHIAFSGPLSLAVEFHKPVVASNVGQIGYFVNKYEIGELFDCDNYETLADATNSLVKRLNNNNMFSFEKCVDENTWEAMAQRIEKLYS